MKENIEHKARRVYFMKRPLVFSLFFTCVNGQKVIESHCRSISTFKSDLQQRQDFILLLREEYLVLMWSLTVSMVPLLTGYLLGC